MVNLQPKMSVFGYPAKLQIQRESKKGSKSKKIKKHFMLFDQLARESFLDTFEKASRTHFRELTALKTESLLHLWGYIHFGNKKQGRPNTHTLSLHFYSLSSSKLGAPKEEEEASKLLQAKGLLFIQKLSIAMES